MGRTGKWIKDMGWGHMEQMAQNRQKNIRKIGKLDRGTERNQKTTTNTGNTKRMETGKTIPDATMSTDRIN